ELRGVRIVVARAFVAQRSTDDDEIRRRLGRDNLSCRRHAQQQPAAAREQLLRNQDRERRAHRAADDADGPPGKRERIEFRVVARPRQKWLCRARAPEVADNVAIGVEDADRRHIGRREALLPSCLVQQRARRDYRIRQRRLVLHNGRLTATLAHPVWHFRPSVIGTGFHPTCNAGGCRLRLRTITSQTERRIYGNKKRLELYAATRIYNAVVAACRG